MQPTIHSCFTSMITSAVCCTHTKTMRAWLHQWRRVDGSTKGFRLYIQGVPPPPCQESRTVAQGRGKRSGSWWDMWWYKHYMKIKPTQIGNYSAEYFDCAKEIDMTISRRLVLNWNIWIIEFYPTFNTMKNNRNWYIKFCQ